MTKISLQDWVDTTRHELARVREFSALETYAIASLVLNQPREWLITHGDTLLNEEQLEQLGKNIDKLKNGVPLPYITGKQAFYGLDFVVTPDVLIPRPETELLVEEALAWLESHPDARTMIDIGTGSGIIPVTIADHIPDLSAIAIDLSENALTVASQNIHQFGMQERVSTLQNDLLDGTALQAHLITANLPYIPNDRLGTLEVAKYEPLLALDGGPDGLSVIRRLLGQLPAHLLPGGLALLEIDCSHATVAIREATKLLSSAKISVLNDLADLPRILKIQF